MPVTLLPVAKKVPGINFPIDHETYPKDCKNIACTKIAGRYRPRSWILVTQRWDDSEEDFMEVENYACIECVQKEVKDPSTVKGSSEGDSNDVSWGKIPRRENSGGRYQTTDLGDETQRRKNI